MKYFATTVVIDSQKRVLLIYHLKSLSWRFPGGKVESGETSEECAIRELREEVDLTPVGKTRFVGSAEYKINNVDWYGYFYVVRSWRGEPRVVESDKASHLCWRPLTQCADLDDAERDAIALAQLSPIQNRILEAIAAIKEGDNVKDGQLAARLGISYRSYTNHIIKIRRLLGIRDHKRHRFDLGAWWSKFGRN